MINFFSMHQWWQEKEKFSQVVQSEIPALFLILSYLYATHLNVLRPMKKGEIFKRKWQLNSA